MKQKGGTDTTIEVADTLSSCACERSNLALSSGESARQPPHVAALSCCAGRRNTHEVFALMTVCASLTDPEAVYVRIRFRHPHSQHTPSSGQGTGHCRKPKVQMAIVTNSQPIPQPAHSAMMAAARITQRESARRDGGGAGRLNSAASHLMCARHVKCHDGVARW